MTEDWMHNHPSTATSWIVKGDATTAAAYRGDGVKLLYELNNSMKFNRPGMNKMTRLFSNGAVITAQSHFGMNILTIDVSRVVSMAAEIAPECTINFGEITMYLPPMKPGEVLPADIEGQDYVKTYYTYDVSKCKNCDWPLMTLQFTFVDDVWPHYDDIPEDHCVVSQGRSCSGEVIEYGADEEGSFVIWKVYTEGSNHNRSGLGYVLVSLEIHDKDTGEIVCSESKVVVVNCCLKDHLQLVDIYWQCGIWTPCETDPLEIFGGELGRVPSLISYLTLSDCISKAGGCAFYALPEVGGCPPYEWTLTGPGKLLKPDLPLNREVIYQGEDDYHGCEHVIITVKDRCGSEDTIVASCCNFAGSPIIDYTTLSMQCSGVQTLYVYGGCGPWKWSISSSGSIAPSADGGFAVFTAPASNSYCGDNTIVTVTDCCGKSAQITIAVNCDTATTPAYYVFSWVPFPEACTPQCAAIGGTGYRYDVYAYRCDGTLQLYNPGVGNACCGAGFNPYAGGTICQSGVSGPNCDGSAAECSFHYHDGFGGWGDCYLHGYLASGEAVDCRTAAQKLGGCCPLNPYTGLPF